MAKILPDREVKQLLQDVIVGGDAGLVNPHGVELRLGRQVRFLSTGEERELKDGQFLRVIPGETVLISSYERIDFTAAAVQKHFPGGRLLMAIISPTTTMMREGIAQVTTKIDAGFRGYLNWSLKNNSNKDFIIRFAEPIYKLTLLLLEKDEASDVQYGEAEKHHYQDTEGIMPSLRRLPVDIPPQKLVSSSFEKLDPKKQLREAGYPFNHISTELVELHGKFEVVSTDVRALKDQFDKQTRELSGKIEAETRSLATKLEETKSALLDRVESLFSRKFGSTVAVIVSAISILYGVVLFLQKSRLNAEAIAFIAMILGIVALVVTWVLNRRR